MIKIENSIRVMAGVVALLIMAPPSAVAQEKKHAAVALEKHAAPAQVLKRAVAGKPHHLILQVNVNDPAMMNLALNIAMPNSFLGSLGLASIAAQRPA